MSGCGPSRPKSTENVKCKEREEKSQGVVPAAHRPQSRVHRVQSAMREKRVRVRSQLPTDLRPQYTELKVQ